jgi:K+-sensing histidine kinase KdpD
VSKGAVDTASSRGYPCSVGPSEWSSALLTARRTGRRIVLGVLVAAVASVPAVGLVRAIHTPFRGLPFVLVIVAATLVGGPVAGFVAAALAVLAVDWFIVPPAGLSFSPGTQFWSLVFFASIMFVIAQLVGWLERTAEQERLERERAALLVRIGDAMSSAVGQERALREVARILVPSFADWAVVHARRGDGSIARVAAVHAAGEELERELLSSPEPDPAADRGVAAVIRSGRTERYVSPAVEEVRRMTADEKQLDVVLRAGLGSSVVVPLTARERTLGALTVVRSPRRPLFSDRDVALVEEVGERSALVVDNLRLVELERRAAGLTAVLQELTAALSAAVTPADVGQIVVEQGTRALAASAAVFAVRGDEGRVELREAFGFDDAAPTVMRAFSIDDPLPLSQAMRTGRAVVIRSGEPRSAA